jgi:hypothetical protein
MFIRALSPRRVLGRVYRGVFGTPAPDGVRGWEPTTAPGLTNLTLLHVGDCGLRTMEAGHDFRAPLGFPAVAAAELARDGIGVEFFHYFAVKFEQLPDIELLRRRTHLSGDPDVIVVQLGANYGRRIVIPDRKLVQRFRVDLARRLGRRVFLGYRLLRPLVRVFGRHPNAYHGTGALERFLRAAAEEWPEARIVLLQPFYRAHPYPTQRPIQDRTCVDMSAAAKRCGVEELDLTDLLGTDPALRGANGYNLNWRGSEMVGSELASWIRGERADSNRRLASATA